MSQSDILAAAAAAAAAANAEDAMLRAHVGPQECEGADCPPALPAAAAQEPIEQKSPARWAYERLALYMQAFEQGLNAEEELAMGFAGAAAGVLRIEGIGYFDPDIVTFYGTDDEGGRTQLIQHVSQLNVMLRAVAKPDPGQEPQRIGFRLVRDLAAAPAETPPAGAGDVGAAQ